MIMFQLVGLGSVDYVSVINTIVIWGLIITAVILFAVLGVFIYNWVIFKIQVNLVRQVGEPYYETDDKDDQIMRVNYQVEPKVGRLYNKKMRGGGQKEYMLIKGTNYNHPNYFSDKDFYFRVGRSILDFKNRGINLFVDPIKGLVPLRLSNPGFVQSSTTLNEVVGAISDGLHERDKLYRDDFWSKYGALITVSILIGFFVIGMLFIIKYQDVFWKNSMNALESTFQTIKDMSAPALK